MGRPGELALTKDAEDMNELVGVTETFSKEAEE